MSDFSTSTHRSKWILSRQELTEKRAIANDAAIKMLEQYGTTRVDVDIDGTISYPEPVFDLNSTAEINTSKKPLSFEEEQYLRVYYEHKIQEVCDAFYFPEKIQATALIYFKRFYLMWSVMQYHPKNIMLTCIYASCKVEENHVSAEELGKGISQDHLPILHNEMLVLQSLGFDLIVFAPYRSINGFVDDLEESGEVRHGDQEKLKETAFKEADKIMLTDAPLLFAPGQLALAALRRSNEINRIIDFERYLDSIISRQNSAYSVAELNELLSSIDYMVDQLEIPTNKDMTRSNKKLNICLAQDAGKKKERKSKRSKRTASEME